MASNSRRTGKKYFTAAEANATLPLVRVVVRDIIDRAAVLRERHDRLQQVMPPGQNAIGEALLDEVSQLQAELESDQDQLNEYFAELNRLGIELKDPFTGLIDFPCWMNEHEVYLCWRYGEPEVAHWHELDAGFAGRQKLPTFSHDPQGDGQPGRSPAGRG